jgi:hypothetical protein
MAQKFDMARTIIETHCTMATKDGTLESRRLPHALAAIAKALVLLASVWLHDAGRAEE